MKQYSRNTIVGTFCVTLGLVGVFLALGELIIRLLAAALSIFLINYGLRLHGINAAQRIVGQLVMRRWFM